MSEAAPRAAPAADQRTADGFADSWNRVGDGSVYTREQFLDWIAPLDPEDIAGREVLELGFGNGSLLYHMADYRPRRLAGVELGDTFATARRNLAHVPEEVLDLRRGDLTKVDLGRFDLVFCIGVLHHLQEPEEGFHSVLRHTRAGGRFHCWVYAREGNLPVRLLVEPLRRVTSRLPWWITKYGIALPLVLPYFAWAKGLRWLKDRVPLLRPLLARTPLHDYTTWIGRRSLSFFHHVAFDQLVARRTTYLSRTEVEGWLADERVKPGSAYLHHRNRNSWKLGGRRRTGGEPERADRRTEDGTGNG